MNLTGIVGLLFLLFFLGVLLFYGVLRRKSVEIFLRAIPAFQSIRQAIGISVEAGTRFHFSVGRGGINTFQGAVALIGFRMLERITRIISISDRLPVVSSGDGSLTILSQDTLQSTYRNLGEETQYEYSAARLTGPTPFSFAAGAIPIILDEQVSANVLIGHFGSEVALFTETAERNESTTLAGTDNLNGQAVLYAAVDEPLIGEEVFAGGAYLQAGTVHLASLRTQDVFRWVLIGFLLLGAMLKFFGLADPLLNLLLGAP